jgi:23S rRNA pseudouridine1911/1915/1917 synthase
VASRPLMVPDGLDGERLDRALSRMLGVSRTRAADLVDGGFVESADVPEGRAGVDDGPQLRPSTRVAGGAMLLVDVDGRDEAASPAPAAAAAVPGMSVVHDDEEIVVVDKPVGVAAHPSPGWDGPSVPQGLSALGYQISTAGAAERQGVVHRLDVGTSGLMVMAKTDRAYATLKQQFRERVVEKVYHAVVQGHMDPLRGTIDAPIGRHPTKDYRWAVVAGGRPSVTHYDTLEAFRGASLLEIHLETGRTHQIRVHVAAMRHPCVGDRTYGADPTLAVRLGLQRQWLHATRLGFHHPRDGEWVEFSSGYPADLSLALERLRVGS